jgi:hypothetical protein
MILVKHQQFWEKKWIHSYKFLAPPQEGSVASNYSSKLIKLEKIQITVRFDNVHTNSSRWNEKLQIVSDRWAEIFSAADINGPKRSPAVQFIGPLEIPIGLFKRICWVEFTWRWACCLIQWLYVWVGCLIAARGGLMASERAVILWHEIA